MCIVKLVMMCIISESLPLNQWPLSSKKIEAAINLVKEQLEAGHDVLFTSPWDTPIFVIKKKNNNWRLLQDLYSVNAIMAPMGARKAGWPSSV